MSQVRVLRRDELSTGNRVSFRYRGRQYKGEIAELNEDFLAKRKRATARDICITLDEKGPYGDSAMLIKAASLSAGSVMLFKETN
jgi:hypothetical protein